MEYDEIMKKLKSLANPKNIKEMVRFGINPKNTFGVSIPDLRALAKKIKKNHALAQQLWNSGIHEAKIFASMIDDKEQVTEKQMDTWIKDFDSWDVCDQVCMNLFAKTLIAWKKASEWTAYEKEFEKRAGFVLMACLAVHQKENNEKEALDKMFFGFSTCNKTRIN